MRSNIIRTTTTALVLCMMAASAGVPDAGTTSSLEPVGSKLLSPFRPKPAQIEAYADYDGQTRCKRGTKVAVRSFVEILRDRFGANQHMGTWRTCVEGSVSEHYEGRALDWSLDAKRYRDRILAKKVIRWLFKKDSRGNRHAVARRLGIMYIIWNGRMWRAYRDPNEWKPYKGSNKHTDHMHISWSRVGGMGLTSFWTGEITDVSRWPIPLP